MRLALVALLTAASLNGPAAQPSPTVFVGSTPCNEVLRTILALPTGADVGLIEWELTLTAAADATEAGTYHLRFRFGQTRPNQPGLDAPAASLERRGAWRLIARGQPARRVVALDNQLSLLKVSDAILHALTPDGGLMVGNGGWSYSLVRSDALERNVEARLAAADPRDPDRTTSRATGPEVFGIFDGRTPCQGIARELNIGARPGCSKAKWRLTLFHDPQTRQPTTYRLEGTLYALRAREGSWRIAREATPLPGAEVYELAPPTGESPALLLKGDHGVLFFLDRNRQPLPGNARLAYTLDRRPPFH
jgi:hypothetical protein